MVRAVLRTYLKGGTPGLYGIGCDPSEGIPGGDPIAAVVLRFEDWRVAAVLHGYLEPHRLAHALVKLSGRYVWKEARPIVAVEKAGPGGTVLYNLRGTGVALYGRPLADGRRFMIGWNTDKASRSHMFGEVRRLASKFWLNANDREMLGELKLLQLDDRGEVRALGGDHEDMAVALAIACAVRREKVGPYPMAVPGEEKQKKDFDPRSEWIWESEKLHEESRQGIAAETEEMLV